MLQHDDPRDVQPPITSDQELANYREGLERFNDIVANREAELFASQRQGDPKALEAARFALYRAYRRRQGIVDAIEAYVGRQGQQGVTQSA